MNPIYIDMIGFLDRRLLMLNDYDLFTTLNEAERYRSCITICIYVIV